jgi:aerobic-type carbon monoxide dehydrogenase small subunit (CoxS/CutS family)
LEQHDRYQSGRQRRVAARDGTTLLELLRDSLQLSGTKQGCDGGECGACTVLVDGEPRLACITLAASVEARHVETIEALADQGRLSALQRSFHEHLGVQCGFCTPGMVMAAEALLRHEPAAQRGADPRGAVGQSVPLHRLREDHRVGAGRSRPTRGQRRSTAMKAEHRRWRRSRHRRHTRSASAGPWSTGSRRSAAARATPPTCPSPTPWSGASAAARSPTGASCASTPRARGRWPACAR